MMTSVKLIHCIVVIEQHPLLSPATAVEDEIFVADRKAQVVTGGGQAERQCRMFSSSSGSNAGSLSYSVISSRWGGGIVSTPLAECRRQGANTRSCIEKPPAIGNPREQPRHVSADANRRENLTFFLS